MPTLVRAVIVWLALMAAETAQGAARRLLFDASDLHVRQVSVLTGSLVIFLIAWACEPVLKIRTAWGALKVGGLWVALTLAFEVAIGRLSGLSWTNIGSDYDLTNGGLMPLGLTIMALTPWIVRRLRMAT
jgi:hypothetical protein